MTWYHPALAQRALDDGDKQIAALKAEIQQLRDYLVQIRNVCRDNAPESCNQRMALDFVHQVAAAALSPSERETP